VILNTKQKWFKAIFIRGDKHIITPDVQSATRQAVQNGQISPDDSQPFALCH
jgi:hypothetical protein